MRKKKFNWTQYDIFAIPLNNGKYAIGHVLDQRMPNTIRIAIYDEVIDSLESVNVSELCKSEKLLSLLEVTKEQIDFGVWKVIGNKPTTIPISRYPNEQYRDKKWAGSSIYDAALAEDFVNAFYALIPWDDWYVPNFLEEFLIDKSKKPTNLILIKS